ncbi:hypothetical protein B566_EDAN015003 [Ephemera danica]|nr:hypothetical protein B566_EDAN015003 [Ephemera danica]
MLNRTMAWNAAEEGMDNFYSRCLLCTCRPDVSPHLHISSEAGNQLQLAEKINKYLNIQIVPELPQRVCHSCRLKLEVTHELVTSSQRARIMLLQIKQRWTSLGLEVKHENSGYFMAEVDSQQPATDSGAIDNATTINCFTTDSAAGGSVTINRENSMDIQINEIISMGGSDSNRPAKDFDHSDSAPLFAMADTQEGAAEEELISKIEIEEHSISSETDELACSPKEAQSGGMEEDEKEHFVPEIDIEQDPIDPDTAGDEEQDSSHQDVGEK